MFTPAELAIVRRAYAKHVTAAVRDAEVEAAFARVPRENFLNKGPWPIVYGVGRYVATPSDDPVYLYTNQLVGIVPQKGLNNGEPSLHAHWLSRAKPKPGEHIVHIGTGWGYYTAIMAEMVGPSGRVTGIEFEPELAARARENLKPYHYAAVIAGDGATAPFDDADVIYVNAGATRPSDTWLDRLNDGGRLVLPLTTAEGFTLPDRDKIAMRGAVFLITRKGDAYDATWISPVAVYPCAGARDEQSECVLAAALATGRFGEVTRLYRTIDVPDGDAFLKAPGWCLAYR
ncbi:MAG: methyltransferase domain-containing protein [Micropepsaceae bacterium]